jgi:hypothetical protein
MDDLRGIWSLLRELRARRPGKARESSERALVFGAALHQAEELMRAAASVDYGARPLPLFYAVSQAGRAIAAASSEDPWELSGHGLKHELRQPLFRSLVRPSHGQRDSFSRVLEAVGGGQLSSPVELGSLWASLPELFPVDLPKELWRRPLRVLPDETPPALLVLNRNVVTGTICGLPNRVLESLEGEDARNAVLNELAMYPQSQGWQLPPEPSGARLVRNDEYGWDVEVRCPVETPGERALVIEQQAPQYRSHDDRWLRPTLNDEADWLSPLMAWWSLLYGLSMLARYHPAPWTTALDVDNSQLAVPLEYALDEALEAVPRLILTALQE